MRRRRRRRRRIAVRSRGEIPYNTYNLIFINSLTDPSTFLPSAKPHGQQMLSTLSQNRGMGLGKKSVLPSVEEPYLLMIFGGKG